MVWYLTTSIKPKKFKRQKKDFVGCNAKYQISMKKIRKGKVIIKLATFYNFVVTGHNG